MSGDRPFLIVLAGEPYEGGSRIYLSSDELVLGRAWGGIQPDVSFTSRYISKRHALITWISGQIAVTDLGSKHGTQVNGYDVIPQRPVILRNGDQISLARGTAVLLFNSLEDYDSDDTIDFTGSLPIASTADLEQPQQLVISVERRQVLVDGRQLRLLGKEMELLLFLYRNRNKAVSYNHIRKEVWPERPPSSTGDVPDVGSEEINALVYRLRKRLGRYGQKVVTVPRFGYMLDL